MPEPVTGTPQNDGDAAKQPTTGTPADGGDAAETQEQLRERIAKLEAEKAQWLPEKSNLEQLKREKAARDAAPAFTPPNAGANQLQQDWANTQLLAQQGDPIARMLIAQDQIYGAQVRSLRLENEAMKVPDAYRADVKAALETGKYADADSALKAVRLDKELPAKESEIARLTRENETLRRADEARKAGVVGAGRSVPDLSKSQGAEPKNLVEFNSEMDRLSATDPNAAQELSRRYRKMELAFQRAG